MITFLANQYFINSLAIIIGLSIFPIILGMELDYVLHRTIFMGGIFGGVYTVIYLKSRNIWPLYNNLRQPVYLLLGLLFLLVQILNLSLNLFF